MTVYTFGWVEGKSPDFGRTYYKSPMQLSDMPMWKKELSSNRIINGFATDFPFEERSVFMGQGIKSTLNIPIFLKEEFWGFIGFDDTKKEQLFLEREAKTLQSAGVLIVSGYLRNEAMTNLIEAKDSLLARDEMLRSLNDVAALLMGSTIDNYESSILKALEIFGVCMKADRAYIWKNEMIDGKLCCSQVSEWAKSVSSKHDKIPAKAIPYDLFVPNWEERINSIALNLTEDQFDEALSNFPGMEDVQSCLVIPLMIKGEFWGFIGIDDIHEKKVFSEMQEDILLSGGMMMASFIGQIEMTRSLIDAREQALASMNAKSEFLSRMSHEMRTPMNVIIGMTTIAKKLDDLEKVRMSLEKVGTASHQLLSIINDVLDMSKIDANKLEISEDEFDFERMLQNVLNVVQVKIDEKRQFLQLKMDPFTRNIVGDELRLSQVLINLLTNAAKFTPEEGHITIAVRAKGKPQAGNEGTLFFDIVDTGIGIPEERIPYLFQSFEQADGGITRQYGGTGLGLAISQRIVEMMGGTIRVSSELGKGSTFSFDVKIKWGTVRVSTTKGALKKSLRILVVDDVLEMREYFSSVLSGFSLYCDVASDGLKAIDMVKQAIDENQPYDVIFIDWKMPYINGGETAQRIRELTENNAILVTVSAMEWSEIEQEAKSFGVTDFLPKPVLPSVLYNTLVELTSDTLVEHADPDDYKHLDWSDKRILLVEDIEINREIVMSILEETGVQIDSVGDGQAAVDAFSKSPDRYDMILMDVQMPILDGLGATRKIRSLPIKTAKTIPIVAMTANAFKEDERECLASGMNDHIGKPIEVDKLFSKLAKYLDRD